MDLKNIKPIFKKKEQKVKDPIRYPKVIEVYEDESKRGFVEALQIEQEMLFKKMKDLI